ncbi:MAG: hypothetical protein WAT19_04600 [Ferruginibacter sp.]
MAKSKKTYSLLNRVSAILMILTLAWLTVSTPFIMGLQEQLAKSSINIDRNDTPMDSNEEDNAGFPGSNTEEKAPGGLTNLSEEYLHQHHSGHHWVLLLEKNHKLETIATYTAYHGELHVPPPNNI